MWICFGLNSFWDEIRARNNARETEIWKPSAPIQDQVLSLGETQTLEKGKHSECNSLVLGIQGFP